MKTKLLALSLLALPLAVEGQTIFRNGFEGNPTTPPIPDCVSATGAPYSIKEYSWARMFYGNAWPDVQTSSILSPVGSFTTKTSSYVGAPAAGLILTTKFKITAPGPNKLGWVGAQGIPAHNYGTPQRARQVTVNISSCRAAIKAKCTDSASNGNMVYGTTSSVPECVFPLGSELWLTIHFMDKNTVDPRTNTCLLTNPSGGVRCDANFKN